MPAAAILVSSYDPGFLAIFEHAVRHEIEAGRRPIVLDVTPAMAAPPDSYHRGVLAAFRLSYPGRDLEQRMAALGAEYVRVEPGDHEPPLDVASEQVLAVSVGSALNTYLRTDRPNFARRRVARLAEAFTVEGRRIYRAVTRLIDRVPDLEVAYVANGRFPNQKLAAAALAAGGVPTLFLEKGDRPTRAYIQPYAPQERVRSQASVTAVLDGMDDDEIEAIADAWLAARRPSPDSSNQFASLWGDSIPTTILEQKASGRRVAGLFTSSQDEFQALGPEWSVQEWTSQLEAIEVALERLEGAGYACYLRVHPNLATKAHDSFIRERRALEELARRHPGLAVIWHDEPANSYALLDNSDVVVVWNSTIGLEASARGIPVLSLAASRYNLIADVREALSRQSLDEQGVDPWDVQPGGAKRFIAYIVLRDEDLVTDPGLWLPWDTRRPPIGSKLAAIAVSGGTPGVWHALVSIADPYRHRGASASMSALRRRLRPSTGR